MRKIVMQIGFKTDIGQRRENNEDSLFLLPEQNIYMVADGVGGHNSGEVASMTAVDSIAQYVKAHPMDGLLSDESIGNYFLECIQQVNKKIFTLAKENPDLAGMATTIVILYLYENNAYFTNVGDSRAYIIRSGELIQVTEDHTYVNELLRNGSITEEEAAVHPRKNMITRALGGEEKIHPDYYKYTVLEDDIIILCSDGLYGEINPEDILHMAAEAEDMDQLSTSLVDLANANGGSDNITIICIKI
jgi:serine/threonine protein phosphatase PrpC